MPLNGLNQAIQTIAELAKEDVAWEALRGAQGELRERTGQLEEQLSRLPAPLVAVLFGGTGTGKSTLLNALAGACIAEMGEHRPTTEEPTVYHPASGVGRELGPARYVASEHLESLVLVDMPDTDSVRHEHAARVEELLRQADVVLFCGSQQKYKNERSLALLRPLKNQRKVVCIQTRADQDEDIRLDWLRKMQEEGFPIDRCYRVSAFNALKNKRNGNAADDGYEFDALEEYLREKLPPERANIKRKNLAGAVADTVQQLKRSIGAREPELRALDARLRELEGTVAAETLAELEAQLLAEPMAWILALGEAVSERAFGLIGTLYRILHWVWVMPSRFTGRLAFAGLLKALSDTQSGPDGKTTPAISMLLQTLGEKFRREHAEAGAYLVRTGFPPPDFGEWKERYVGELSARLESGLKPVNERVHRRARRIARYLLPLLELCWLAPFAFTIGVPICNYYWHMFRHADVVLPETGFLGRSAAMLAAVLFVELVFFTYFVRSSGRQLYHRLRRDLRKKLEGGGFGFEEERSQIGKAAEACATINALDPASE